MQYTFYFSHTIWAIHFGCCHAEKQILRDSHDRICSHIFCCIRKACIFNYRTHERSLFYRINRTDSNRHNISIDSQIYLRNIWSCRVEKWLLWLWMINIQIIRNISRFVWNIRSDWSNYRKNVIYSYRVEQAMAINLLPTFDMKNDIIIYRNIICAVLIHRKAMELVFILYMYIMNKRHYQETINITL